MSGILKITDDDVRQASDRISNGELQSVVARSYGMSARGLYDRLVALGLHRGTRGRRKFVPLNHCRTCRCKDPSATVPASPAANGGDLP